MVHKSNTAFLEPKMLLLYIFLVSCCLPGSMGDAVEEFKENLEKVVERANEEIILPVPKGNFQCSHVPCQLKKTIEGLKLSFKNYPAIPLRIIRFISLMEKNAAHITSTLMKTHTQPKNTFCLVKHWPKQRALECFRKYFQKVHENCWES